MNKDEQEHQKFLEELLEWCKEQERIFFVPCVRKKSTLFRQLTAIQER